MIAGALAAWPDPFVGSWDYSLSADEIAATPLAAHRRDAVEACHRWREAAAADGWSIRPTYGDREEIERAWTAERDGFTVQGIARGELRHGSRLPVATLSIWGPDRLAISPAPTYDLAAILAGVRCCLGCGATDVETERVAFVGRYCAPCAARERPIQERDGWCD